MLADHLLQAFSLFALGMGTVFILLSMLIFAVWQMSYITKKIEHAFSNSNHFDAELSVKLAHDSEDPEIAAAIAAVKQYRNSKNSD